jgi:hypothetical protein
MLINKLGTFGQSRYNILNRNTMVHWISLNYAHTLMPSSDQNLNYTWAGIIHYILSLAFQTWYEKNTKESFFFIYDILPVLVCYILLDSFHISIKFKVFPFKWYQEYAYPCFSA